MGQIGVVHLERRLGSDRLDVRLGRDRRARARHDRLRQRPSGHRGVWAITLFPRGFDQVIPQVLAVFLFYLPLVFPVGMTRPGLLFGR